MRQFYKTFQTLHNSQQKAWNWNHLSILYMNQKNYLENCVSFVQVYIMIVLSKAKEKKNYIENETKKKNAWQNHGI